jgi:hypothetical protein
LGTDVFDHQPQVIADDSGIGRQWRRLMNDVQITLHNHPRNAQRVASGSPPINSLWFWGAGPYPAHVSVAHAAVYSDDALLRSLAMAAAVGAQPLPQCWQASMAESLVDLRQARDMEALTREWIMPAIKSLSAGANDTVIMDFMDGSQFLLSRGQRWRFWRKPLRSLSVPHVESRAPSS